MSDRKLFRDFVERQKRISAGIPSWMLETKSAQATEQSTNAKKGKNK
jgi:hypothetical protein